MVKITLDGSIRKDLGSANTNRLRKEGFIPAVIYGGVKSRNIFISVPKKDFDKEYLKGGIEVKTIELTVDGNIQNVIVYQIDIDPLTDLPRHIDFMLIDGKEEIKTFVPVNYVGHEKSPGLKKGGFLNILKRKLHLFVSPKDIPQEIKVDVGAMHIGSKIRMGNLELPSNVRPVDKTNFALCSVTGRGKSDDVKTDVVATSDASATTTAPTATSAEKQPATKAPAATGDKK